MKQAKLYLSLCFLAITAAASAQFMNVKETSSSVSLLNPNTNGWNRIQVSLNPIGVDYSKESDFMDAFNLMGISAGYMKGFSLSRQFPIFIETGIAIQWGFKTMDLEDYKEYPELKMIEDKSPNGNKNIESKYKVNLFSINVPVNLGYRFSINDKFSIMPYVGLDLRGNIVGTLTYKNEVKDVPSGSTEKEYLEKCNMKSSKDYNLFDKKDMGDKDFTWKRFQIGWHIGVGLNASKFYASVSYGTDFNEIVKNTKLSTTSITVGYSF